MAFGHGIPRKIIALQNSVKDDLITVLSRKTDNVFKHNMANVTLNSEVAPADILLVCSSENDL
jgi:hypothetical protein